MNRRADLTEQPAPGPAGSSELGSLPELQQDPLEFFLHCRRRFGDVVRFRIGPERVAHLVSDPDAVREILVVNRRNYTKGESWKKSAEPGAEEGSTDLVRRGSLLSRRFLLGEGLLTSEGNLWQRQRRTIYPVFQRGHLKEFAGTMNSAIAAMLTRWETVSEIDLEEEMASLGLDIVARTLFGEELSSEEAAQINRVMRKILSLTNARADKQFDLPREEPQRGAREFDELVAEFDNIIWEMIRRCRASSQITGDFLSLLITARDEETGEAMSDRQVRDEVATIFLAGHETTASALSWTFFLLSSHPEPDRLVREEVQRVLKGRTPAVQDLPQLQYTSRVIEEALRLYPPAWLMLRHTVQDDEILGCRIPARTDVIISPFVVHRHPVFWTDPERFDPERFQEGTRSAQHRFAYIPFGGGPRVCIGRGFALMEIQLVVAWVLQRFRMAPLPDHTVRPKARFILQSETGIPVSLTRAS